MNRRIFVTHGATTADEAKALSAELQRHGAEIVDSSGLLAPGEQWTEKLQAAMADSDAFVFVVRPDEEPSEFLRLEWRKAAKLAALNPEKKIIPVVLGDQGPPAFLRLWQAVSMSGDVGRAGARVIEAIQAPGANEASTDSAEWRPVVEAWRQRLDKIETSARLASAGPLEVECVD